MSFGGTKGEGKHFQAEGAPGTQSSKYERPATSREIQTGWQEPLKFIRKLEKKDSLDKKERATNYNELSEKVSSWRSSLR